MFSNLTMTNALRLITARSADAGAEAMHTLRAISAHSPILQIRYNRTVEMALADRAANWTADERALLGRFVDASDSQSDNQTVSMRLPRILVEQIDDLVERETPDLRDRTQAVEIALTEFLQRHRPATP